MKKIWANIKGFFKWVLFFWILTLVAGCASPNNSVWGPEGVFPLIKESHYVQDTGSDHIGYTAPTEGEVVKVRHAVTPEQIAEQKFDAARHQQRLAAAEIAKAECQLMSSMGTGSGQVSSFSYQTSMAITEALVEGMRRGEIYQQCINLKVLQYEQKEAAEDAAKEAAEKAAKLKARTPDQVSAQEEMDRAAENW